MGKAHGLLDHQHRVTFQRLLPGNANFCVVGLPDGTLAAVGRVHVMQYRLAPVVRALRCIAWNPQGSVETTRVHDAKLVNGDLLVVTYDDHRVAFVDLSLPDDVPASGVAIHGDVRPTTGVSAADEPVNAVVPVRVADVSCVDAPLVLGREWRAAAALPDGRLAGHGVNPADPSQRMLLVASPSGVVLSRALLPAAISASAVLGPVCVGSASSLLIAERHSHCVHVVNIDSGEFVVTLVADKLRLNDIINVSSITVVQQPTPRVVLATSIGRAYALDTDGILAGLLGVAEASSVGRDDVMSAMSDATLSTDVLPSLDATGTSPNNMKHDAMCARTVDNSQSTSSVLAFDVNCERSPRSRDRLDEPGR